MPLAAENPTDRVKQLIVLTDRLADIVEKETILLRERRPVDIRPFQDERTKLSNIYVQEMQMISKNTNLISGVAQELTNLLKDKTSKFREKLNEHGRLLFRIRNVTEGIIKAIADDVSDKNNAGTGYAKDASVGPMVAKRPASISLDETV